MKAIEAMPFKESTRATSVWACREKAQKNEATESRGNLFPPSGCQLKISGVGVEASKRNMHDKFGRALPRPQDPTTTFGWEVGDDNFPGWRYQRLPGSRSGFGVLAVGGGGGME